MTEVTKPVATEERIAWERPELKRLEAGAAESAPAASTDQAVLS